MVATAGTHGLNGAVVSFGLDTLCQKSADYFDRLTQVKTACERNGLELIPSVFSVGYGEGVLAHDRNLAEGLPVTNAPLLVQGGKARLVAQQLSLLSNGDFEDSRDNRFAKFDLLDQPGEISFVDTQVHHGGKASIRLENFTANPHGHGRVMQEIRVQPHRCYRVSLWVKTEGLQPPRSFKVMVRGKDRDLAPRTFQTPATSDSRELAFLFNSLNEDHVSLHAGVWGGKSGKLWIDDWRVEEIGPLNVLRRPGTPVTVRDSHGTTTYAEGRDYAASGGFQLQFREGRSRGGKPEDRTGQPHQGRRAAPGKLVSPDADQRIAANRVYGRARALRGLRPRG